MFDPHSLELLEAACRKIFQENIFKANVILSAAYLQNSFRDNYETLVGFFLFEAT